jgi:hypothetical protein
VDARTPAELQRALADSTPPGSVRVTVADQQLAKRAGIHGVLFGLSRADGSTAAARARVEVDYSGFRFAYGGDYGGRLTVVALPTCVLSTPELPQCRTTAKVVLGPPSRGAVLAAPPPRSVSGFGR